MVSDTDESGIKVNFKTEQSATNQSVNSQNEKFKRPCNPESWSRTDVEEWLMWCSNEYALHDIPVNKFEMNGKALCMLTEEMFKQRAPDNGDILYRTLKNLLNKDETVFTNSETVCSTSEIATSEICSKKDNTQQNTNIISNNTINKAQTSSSLSSSSSTTSLPFTSFTLPSTSHQVMKPQTDAYAQFNKHKKSQSMKQEKSYSCKENTNTEDDLDIKQPVFEKKRTANLENLIGNIKVRKLNQTEPQQHKKSDEYQMTSLYVDTVHGERSSLGDCSPQSPLLSSPSVSPSSESINAIDSPAHTSPTSSSSSLNGLTNNKSRYSLANPKFRWMMEASANAASMDTTLLQHQLQLDSLKKLDPAKIKELMNSMAWYNNSNTSSSASSCQDLEPTQVNTPTTPKKSTARFNGKKCNYNNNHKASSMDNKAADNNDHSLNTSNSENGTENIANLKYSICPTSKNQEDPTRQIKFYDDFIDFRGDILRRPPDSKNCRILWEYLYLLLQNPSYSSVIRWEDESQMVFRIVQAEKLAALWGLQKNRLGMTYEKLSRGMRYYYPNNIIAREAGRRLLYRFMRHPNEIKKFVKKNGTYMLKRAKLGDKNNTSMDSASMPSGDIDVDTESIADINPEDSSIDESFYEANGSDIKKENTIISNTNHNHSNKFKMNKSEAYTDDFEEAPEFDEENQVSGEDSEYPENQQAQATARALVNAMTAGASANRANNMFSPANMYSRDMFQYYLAAASAGLMNNGAGNSSVETSGNQFLQETIKNLSLNLNTNKSTTSSSAQSRSLSSKQQQASTNSFNSNYNAFQQAPQQNDSNVSQQQQNLANFLRLASNLDIQHPLNLSLGSNGSSNSTSNKNRKNKYDIKVNDN